MKMTKGLTIIQELELLSALESRGESPLKFAYIGTGYRNWIEIANKSRENRQNERSPQQAAGYQRSNLS